MAEDDGGVGLSSEKKYVAGWVTRNAFVSSNALRVTQPAIYFQYNVHMHSKQYLMPS